MIKRTKSLINQVNLRLTRYLYIEGDTSQVIMHKKIWWLLFVFIIVSLFAMIPILGDVEFVPAVNQLNLVFYSSSLLLLIFFHFYRKAIFNYILVSLLLGILIHAAKVYFEGGIMHGLAPIFVGLMCVVWAMILPNKKRALLVFLVYIISITIASILNFDPNNYATEKYHLIVFLFSVIQIFGILYYYITQYEKLKQQEQDRLKEMDAFKTKFYTNITHEFRTPLTIINGLSEKLGFDHQKILRTDQSYRQVVQNNNFDLEEGLEMIGRNGNKLLNLTNQMLELSKIDEGALKLHLVNGNISLFLKYIVESFHSYARTKDIEISFVSSPESIMMDFDPDKIQDIFFNLISNALKFTHQNGKVDLKISNIDADDKVEIVVTDNGPGIPRESLPHIFDRYFQVEHQKQQVVEGTGLGLSLTKELVTLMNGKIDVTSTPGIFTAFTIVLPISNEAAPAEDQFESLFKELSYSGIALSNDDPKVEQEKEGQRLKVLVVEDNVDVIHYISSLLSIQYDIETAINGLEGFKKAQETVPDLVISDIMMPVMDGYTLCKKLKEDLRTSHIPIIMLTALADTDSKIKGLQYGADAYLAKPFNRRELFVRISKLIELRKGLQERYKVISSEYSSQVLDADAQYSKEDTFIQKICDVVEKHLDNEEFSINELCSQLTMSRSQLYRKFNALMDITLNQFIMDYRLDKARKILLSTDMNVSEVAIETGFKNLSHFSKVFTNKFGTSPSKIKNEGTTHLN